MRSKLVWCVLYLLVAILMAGVCTNPVFANSNTRTITCKNKGDCEQNGQDKPFFTAENIVPGQLITQPVSIRNQRKNDGCTIKIRGQEISDSSTEKLKEQLTLQVLLSGALLVQYPLTQLLTTTTPLTVDTLNPDTTRDYLWQIEFAESADNSYQGEQTHFDLDLIFTCDENTREPTPTPTPKPSPTPTPSGSCTTTPPTGQPVVTISDSTPTQVKLRWQKIPEATTYKLSFSTTDTSKRYQNTDLGTATEYTIKGLNPQQDYFFVITPFKGCAAGTSATPVTLIRSLEDETDKATTAQPLRNSRSANPLGQVLGTQFVASDTAINAVAPTTSTSELPNRDTILTIPGIFFILFLIAAVGFFVFFRHKNLHKKPTS